MVDILLLRSALLILLVFYLKCTALRVPLYRQIAQNNVKSGSSVYRVKGELQWFAASTYIELVPPTPKNRCAFPPRLPPWLMPCQSRVLELGTGKTWNLPVPWILSRPVELTLTMSRPRLRRA